MRMPVSLCTVHLDADRLPNNILPTNALLLNAWGNLFLFTPCRHIPGNADKETHLALAMCAFGSWFACGWGVTPQEPWRPWPMIFRRHDPAVRLDLALTWCGLFVQACIANPEASGE